MPEPSAATELIHLTIAFALAALRVLGVKHEAFQAVAHLYVGGLFTAWYYSRDRFFLNVAIGVSLVELAVALWQLSHP